MSRADAAAPGDAVRGETQRTPPRTVALADHHIHTCWSDGRDSAAQSIAVAAALGLPEIGLTDHLAWPTLDYGMPPARLGEYAADMRRAADAAASPHVLVGVEVDYTPQTWPQMLAALRGHSLDYVIGSVHFVDGLPFDEDALLTERRWPDADELFRRYYETVAEMAATGVIDVVGHLDLPKIFGRRPGTAVAPAEEAALDAIAAAGVLVEVNTSGMRYPVGEPFPSPDLLARARARGIGITFGSDAHQVEEVAAGFAEALALARSAGYAAGVRPSDRAEVPLP